MSRRATTIVAWAIVAAAVAIRLFRADAQSLWYDEGTSAQLATRSAAAIVAAAAGDIHPPLYYLLLAAWSRAFGHGVLALRALSAVLGAATVAATIAIGRRLGGRRVALVAGALAATSPYLIWYSQEVRMYVLAGFLGAALVVLALADADALVDDAPVPASPPNRDAPRDAPRIPRTLLIAALVTAALYTQYLAGAAAVAIGGGAMALGWARAFAPSRRRGGRPPWPSVARWLAAMTIAAALFVPWLARAWPVLRDWPALGAPVSLAFVARETLATYAFGIKAPPEWRAWWPVLTAVAFVGVALAWWPGGVIALPGRRARRWASAVALWMAAAPPLLVYAASLRRPAWNPKFIIAGAPGFELLLALAVVGAAEVAAEIAGRHCPVGKRRTWTRRNTAAATSAVALALIAIPRLAVWHANAYDPAYQRDDYRGIAAEIAARAGPEDAVVLDAPTQVEVFGFYDRGAHATFPLP
ncbi:MAG: glycosyltransferase family 39 protein, partial [Ardenticatenales bacterium]